MIAVKVIALAFVRDGHEHGMPDSIASAKNGMKCSLECSAVSAASDS
jgi:hypothetical protein